MIVRLACAVVAGLCLWLSLPAHDLWFLAPLGVALLALACTGVRPRRRPGARVRAGFLLGLVAGEAYFLPTLSWSGAYVGALPWVTLATLEGLYVAALGAVLAGAQRTRVRALVVALGWVVSEYARSTTPFGGFPWARIALGQSGSPFARVATLLGAPGVTFAVALAGGLLAAGAHTLLRRRNAPTTLDPAGTPGATPRATPGERPWTGPDATHPEPRSDDTAPGRGPDATAGAAAGHPGATAAAPGAPGPTSTGHAPTAPALAALLALAVLLLAPLALPQAAASGTGTVMAIQGDVPQLGLDFNAQRRAVLDNHARVTTQAAQKVADGSLPRPDLVLWPENASDIDPLTNADAGAVITAAVAAIGAPTVVGAVLDGPGEYVSNASLLYRPGQAAPVAKYVKQRPAPFGEYIPYRSFFRMFSDKVDLVRRDFAAGQGVGVFTVPTANGGSLAASMNICFEVAFDDLVREGVTSGANLVTVQTNNATFGRTDESVQQLAISRLRAVELHRTVVHISNVGVSAIITPDGVLHDPTEHFAPAVLDAAVPLYTDLTPAARLGAWPERVATLALLALLAWPARRGRNLPAEGRVRLGEPVPAGDEGTR